jgi:hypothetical protein
MPRTTLNLDSSILQQLKERQRRDGRPLGKLVSELLAGALSREDPAPEPPTFVWRSQPMGPRIDLEDRDAVQTILDQE